MEPRSPTYEELVAVVGELRDRVAVLERENADLRRRLEGKKPPPPTPPFVKPSVPARRKRGKPGRPEGHPPAHRAPPPEIHQEVPVPLPAGEAGRCLCPRCRSELEDLKDHERVVEEIVPAVVQVTRYHTRSGYCRHCAKRVESRHAEQPPPGFHGDLPQAQLGLNALAVAAALKHGAGLPYRKVAWVLRDLCGLSVSHGALVKQVRRLGGWLGESADAIGRRLRDGAYVNVDETGWRVGGVNHWLWALTNPDCTLYRVDERRSSAVVRRVLGERYAGHVVSDFLPTYDKLPYKAQKCVPHLLRDIRKTAERNPAFASSPFRKRLKRAAKDLLRLKARWDDLGDDAYCMRASRLADRLDNLAKAGADSPDKDVRRLAGRLKRHAGGLAEFLLVKDLPGDNNAAERALRPAVVIRKISGGHRGATTATAAAVVMSVLRTARQQGKNLIATVKHLVQLHLAGQPCDLFPSPSG